jgi:hypothetical protein
MSEFLQRHALAIAVLVMLLICALLIFAQPVFGEAEWDKSSLSATGQCLHGGILHVTVTNGGQAMQGPVDYGWVAGVTSGTLQLKAGESITLDSPALPNVKIEFWVMQRAGHPGQGIAWVRMTCSPTAVTLNTLAATASSRICLNWHSTCTKYIYIFGRPVCTRWVLTCIRWL